MKRWLAVAACGALVLSGCSDSGDGDGGDGAPAGPAVVQLPVSEASLLVGGPVDEVGEERIVGKPTILNGCLSMTSGTTNFLIVWPSGTKVRSNDSDTLEVDGKTVDGSSTFVGRGTFLVAQPFPDEVPTIPLRCLGPNQQKIAWLQQLDEVSE